MPSEDIAIKLHRASGEDTCCICGQPGDLREILNREINKGGESDFALCNFHFDALKRISVDGILDTRTLPKNRSMRRKRS